MKMVTIHIKNLRLRTYIGFNKEELIKKQDVVINIYLDYDASKAMLSDSVEHACNYKVLTKKNNQRKTKKKPQNKGSSIILQQKKQTPKTKKN